MTRGIIFKVASPPQAPTSRHCNVLILKWFYLNINIGAYLDILILNILTIL